MIDVGRLEDENKKKTTNRLNRKKFHVKFQVT